MPKPKFISAAHYHFLTPLYKSVMELFFSKTYDAITGHVTLKPGEKLLDVGCGPGSILKRLSVKYPSNALTGLDIDPAALAIAKKRLPIDVSLIESSATKIPAPADTFAVVVSTLMIHHLTTEQKQAMLKDIHRVLAPGGKLLLFDFMPPQTWGAKLFIKLIRHTEHLEDAIAGKYLTMTRAAGFKDIQSTYRAKGMFELWEAKK